MAQSLLKIYIHFTWTTKYRAPVLIRSRRRLILQKIRSIALSKGYQIIIINCTADHVHCLLRLRHSDNISRIINDLKGISANWINKNHILKEFFDWQDGYAAFSVSPEKINGTVKYINEQDLHHKLL